MDDTEFMRMLRWQFEAAGRPKTTRLHPDDYERYARICTMATLPITIRMDGETFEVVPDPAATKLALP